MSTNQNIIDRALIEIDVIEAGETANSTDSASALTDFNGMMAEWRESDKDFNWFPQDTLGAVCPIPDWSERAIVANLALSLSAVFSALVTQSVATRARKGEEMIIRTLFNLNLEQADMSFLPQGRDSGRNILTDS